MSTLVPPQDKVAVRVITVGVVVAMLFSVIGVFVLIMKGHDPKDLLPIATGALGAAGGFLARTSTESGAAAADDQPTQVIVSPDQPAIPVDPVEPLPADPVPPIVDGGGDESGGEIPAATTLRRPRQGRTNRD